MELDAPVSLPTRPPKRLASDAAPQQQHAKRPKAPPSPPAELAPRDTASPPEAEPTTSAAPAPAPASGPPTPRTPSASSTRTKKISCSWPGCQKTFSRPVHLQEHLNAHRGERPHACSEPGCGKAFFRRAHLDHHTKNAHSDARPWTCSVPGCGRAFGTGTRLRRHEAAVHGEAEGDAAPRRWDCSICAKPFRKHATLQRHVATAHEGRAAFVCERAAPDNPDGAACGAGFDTAGKLRAHEGRAHGAPRYACMACANITFSTYAAFTAHNRSVHPPSCPRCAFAGRSQRELRRHLEAAHGVLAAPDDLPSAPPSQLPCDWPGCAKAFSKRANLAAHVRTAHQGRRFVCGDIEPALLRRVQGWDGTGACGRAFTAKASLEEHVRTAHLGVPRSGKKKAEKKAVEGQSAPSALELLTGTAFQDPRRNLPCLVPGCAWRFVRKYDRAVHARAKHGLGGDDVRFLEGLADNEAVDGKDQVEDRGQREGDEMDVEMDDDGDWEEQLDRDAQHGGEFWLGGSGEGQTDDWDVVQEDMWRLVDGHDADDEDDEEDEVADGTIDPMLLG